MGTGVTGQSFHTMRQAMVASQLRTNAVSDPRVVAAMAAVPRERFVPREQASLAYLDRAVPLGGGRALPPPMVLGRLLTEARVRPTDRALVVGAGSGYAAAVLARLAGHVVALEEDAALRAIAASGAMAGAQPVSGPLAEGWAAAAPYDLILFDGAVERVPPAIVGQLADGGRFVAPVHERGVVRLMIGRKAGDSLGTAVFADADAPSLPGFAVPRTFSF